MKDAIRKFSYKGNFYLNKVKDDCFVTTLNSPPYYENLPVVVALQVPKLFAESPGGHLTLLPPAYFARLAAFLLLPEDYACITSSRI